jgi:hypothetical protein
MHRHHVTSVSKRQGLRALGPSESDLRTLPTSKIRVVLRLWHQQSYTIDPGEWEQPARREDMLLVSVMGTNRSCVLILFTRPEHPWIASAPQWDGPYTSIDDNHQPFPMNNAEDPFMYR